MCGRTPIALRIGVMDIQAEPRPLSIGCPLEHLEVAVRIAEGRNRAASNAQRRAVRLDADPSTPTATVLRMSDSGC